MNNKTIIEFGFRTIWRIMEISEGVIRFGRYSISKILQMILSLIQQLIKKNNKHVVLPTKILSYYTPTSP